MGYSEWSSDTIVTLYGFYFLVMGKIEGMHSLDRWAPGHFCSIGKQENYHGHVTAISVAPEFRRIGVSSQLMAMLEDVSEQWVHWKHWRAQKWPTHVLSRKKTYFVDLFVRVSNKRAVDMYHKLNYVVYRRIIGYYSGERDEDAFGKVLLTSRTVRVLLISVLFRHAKSVISWCGQEIGHTHSTSCAAGRFSRWLKVIAAILWCAYRYSTISVRFLWFLVPWWEREKFKKVKNKRRLASINDFVNLRFDIRHCATDSWDILSIGHPFAKRFPDRCTVRFEWHYRRIVAEHQSRIARCHH